MSLAHGISVDMRLGFLKVGVGTPANVNVKGEKPQQSSPTSAQAQW